VALCRVRGEAQHMTGLRYLPPIRRPGAVLTEAQQFRKTFRIELFQQHGWSEGLAQHWAAHLVERDADKDDRKLCVECENLLSQWRCAARGAVVAEVLQRCPSFVWARPEKK
jgi:hypothetical protein